MLLENRKGLQGVRDLAEIPLGDGHKQQRVALIGDSRQQRATARQHLGSNCFCLSNAGARATSAAMGTGGFLGSVSDMIFHKKRADPKVRP